MFTLIALIATLNLTYVDTGKTFTLPPQTAIVVTLPSCGTCGYHWRLKPIDRSVLRRVSHHYVAKVSHGAVGGIGKEIWRFTTLGAGTSPLQLVYLPPGRNAKPVRTFSLNVTVG